MPRRREVRKALDWEELEQAPNTRGAFSFLKPQSAVVSIADHRQVEPSLPDSEECAVRPPKQVRTTSTVDHMSTVDVLQKNGRPYRIHPCQKVQDAHSHGENQLYAMLWAEGHADPHATDDVFPKSKIVTMGWDRMARRAGMSDKAAKRNMQQLISKLAVELIAPEDCGIRRGRTYRVYSFTSILEVRKKYGMEYVVKDKGVRFVAKDGSPLQIDITHKTSTVDIPSTVDNTSTVTVDITSPETVDKTSPPLGSTLVSKAIATTTTTQDGDIEKIVNALSMYDIPDQKAALRLLRECREVCPNAEPEEIAEVIREKAKSLQQNPSVRNLIGLLLSSVPSSFEKSCISGLRRRWEAEMERALEAKREKERRRAEEYAWVMEDRKMYKAVLNNPESTEKEKEEARREIEELSCFDEE
jgi:hypothetical protein